MAKNVSRAGSGRIVTGAAVFAVEPTEDGFARVGWFDAAQPGEPRCIAARWVVVAAPFFFAGRILRGIAPKIAAAMTGLSQGSYLVANCCFEGRVAAKTYDSWTPGNPAFTDVVDATVALPAAARPANHSVLTVYAPFQDPAQGRNLLLAGDRKALADPIVAELKHFLPDAFAKARQCSEPRGRSGPHRGGRGDRRQIGLTPQDIMNKFGNSTVYIEVRWQLYDRQTMRAIYQKTIGDPASKTNLPAYVRLHNGRTFRWLTLEHDNKTNRNIGETASGTGFVIDERGYLVTNKHVAAGWMTELDLPRVELLNKDDARGDAIVCNYFEPTKQKPSFKMLRDCTITTTDDLEKINDLARWDPERDAALIFENERPVFISSTDWRELVGRNEVLDVRFPNERLSISANLVRASTDADASLIKVDTPQVLSKVDLADESDAINSGERAMVLGYPAMSLKTFAAVTTEERGNIKTRAEIIPVPTITDGIVSRLGAPMQRAANVTTEGTLGDVFQLQLPSTNGNSGGPVFNATGKVIGIFTYGSSRYANTTFGVPIKYVRALLKAQR